MPDPVVIRPASEVDLPAINDIYNHYVMHSTSTYQTNPCDDAERKRWFAHHGPEHPVIVATTGGRIVAWASLSRFHVREAYRHSVESSIYVHHQHHRRGLGRSLMQQLIATAKTIGHHTILAGISADQTASIALHESLGFEKVAHFREVGRKFDRWLDVVWMQLML